MKHVGKFQIFFSCCWKATGHVLYWQAPQNSRAATLTQPYLVNGRAGLGCLCHYFRLLPEPSLSSASALGGWVLGQVESTDCLQHSLVAETSPVAFTPSCAGVVLTLASKDWCAPGHHASSAGFIVSRFPPLLVLALQVFPREAQSRGPGAPKPVVCSWQN